MVGLSITLGCPIRPDVFERYIPAQRGGFREIMEALIRFRSGEAMHDAVAISTLLDDRLMTWQTGEITVELAPPERSGPDRAASVGACRHARRRGRGYGPL